MKDWDYELQLKRRSREGQKIYEFRSADGVVSKNSFRGSEMALAEAVEPDPEEDALVVQSNYGVLGVLLADQTGEGSTTLADTSDRACQLSKTNLEINNIENGTVENIGFYSELEESYDKIFYAPQAYEPVDTVKNRIYTVAELMEKGNELYVAGEKNTGIKRYRKFLQELPGNTEKISQQGPQKVYRYIKEGQLSGEKPEIETEFKTDLNGLELGFKACKGLFSPHAVDEGTELLIENIEVEKNSRVLDLACGYGVIGVYLKKRFDPQIFLTDDNGTAVRYAEKNLELNDIEDYELKNRDCMDGFEGQKFDVIVSNPPTHQGSNITGEMFEEAYNSLTESGELYIVYNKNMKFEKKLSYTFDTVEVLEEKDNYRVTKAVK